MLHKYMYIYIDIHVYTIDRFHTCMYVCKYTHIYMYTYTYVYRYTQIYIQREWHVYIYIHVCANTNIHTCTLRICIFVYLCRCKYFVARWAYPDEFPSWGTTMELYPMESTMVQENPDQHSCVEWTGRHGGLTKAGPWISGAAVQWARGQCVSAAPWDSGTFFSWFSWQGGSWNSWSNSPELQLRELVAIFQEKGALWRMKKRELVAIAQLRLQGPSCPMPGLPEIIEFVLGLDLVPLSDSKILVGGFTTESRHGTPNV